ncbi:MAG TPA: ribonuclease R [Chthoniobacterales bacterium]|nr:ribonuclease R [Chthoniobacterales bacterium]
MSKNGRTIRDKILGLVREPDYRPQDRNEIAEALGAKGRDRVLVRRTLQELERAGDLVRIRKNRYVLPSEADLIAGKLSIHQAGFGFLVPEKSGEADIFVAAENTGTAMNGDRVVVRINRDVPARARKARAGQRTEGRVIRILERARDTIVGTLQRSKNFYYVVPDDPRIVHNVYVQRPEDRPVNVGDKVVVRLEDWQSRHVNPEGEIVEVLGASDAPGIDMLSIIRKYGLPTEFPRKVIDEANQIPTSVEQRMLTGRKDLRGDFIVTVDPDDARDFDDAINVEKTDNGNWKLGVHIADVSAYVTPNGALDREARRRGNSVYLPDRVIPMLPERLSTGVCSLNPEVDRLTFSVFIEFDRNGRAKMADFARSVIRSAKRLTYKEAYAILQSRPDGELGRRMHTAWELASLLRRKRFEHGSLDLDFPEVKVYVDDKGKPVRLERVENDESHQLIEEFMLAANEAVARELRHRSIPTTFRVHEDPDPEKLGEYREFILSFGYKVGDLSNRKEVQRFLASVRGKPEEQALKIGLLKSLKRARYAAQPLGHYGLAKANYLHFTSPIRRYADLIVHRSLADRNSSRRAKIDIGQLESLAQHISDTERNAADAEIESVRLKKLQFFQQQLDDRNPQVFRAAIIDIRNYGLVVELPDAIVTGLVHVSALNNDFYRFDAVQRRLIGQRSNRRYSVGDEIRVFVARVDTFKQQIDFAIADSAEKGRGRRR